MKVSKVITLTLAIAIIVTIVAITTTVQARYVDFHAFYENLMKAGGEVHIYYVGSFKVIEIKYCRPVKPIDFWLIHMYYKRLPKPYADIWLQLTLQQIRKTGQICIIAS